MSYFPILRSLEELKSGLYTILIFSRFTSDIHYHGGCRRTAQFAEALAGEDVAFVTSEDFYSLLSARMVNEIYPSYPRIAGYLDKIQKHRISNGMHCMWAEWLRDSFFSLNYIAQQWQFALKQNNQFKLAIVDDPIYFAPLITALRKRNIPVVAHCHNIETLSTSQVVPEFQIQLLGHELNLFSMCKKVITISSEETFLLQNLGMMPLYYPYYPVNEIKERMLKIRDRRAAEYKRDLLLLGTAGNMPTFNGMLQFIREWQKEYGQHQCSDRLLVAGFCTDQLREHVSGDEVVFNGVLTDDELDALLVQIKAAVVYQENGSGALTKICEYLIAGIPVLANHHAARSYHNMTGILEFASMTELFSSLASIAAIEGTVVMPKAPDTCNLRTNVLACMQQ